MWLSQVRELPTRLNHSPMSGIRVHFAAVAIMTIAWCVRGVLEADAQLDRLRKLKKDAESAQADDAPMAVIPAGQFWMGRDGTEALEDERPRHQVGLDAYSMDVYEVTTARYAKFLSATGRQ